MKKLISLLSVALLATSVFAIPATGKKMTDQTVLPANIQVSRSSKALDAQALQVANAPKTYDVQRAAIPVAKAMQATQEALPKAFYYKPIGSYFCGINNDENFIPHVFDVYHPTVIGSWLNGYEYWTWPNLATNATSLTYVTSLDQRGLKGYGWTVDKNMNFVDSITATNFGDPMYLFSYRMPVQIATNEAGKDTFFLYGPGTTRPDTLTMEVWTIGGMLNPYNANGLWPLTNAMFSTPKYGDRQGAIWNLDANNKQVEFIYGTEPIALLAQIDTTFAADNVTIEKLDSIYDTIQPAALWTNYQKPMSPLYVKNITVALCNVDFNTGGPAYENIQIDTLRLAILDQNGKPIATSVASYLDTAKTYYYPGQTVTFKIQKQDAYGTIIEGVTLTDRFSIVITGLDRPANRFGIWSAFDPYLGGRQNYVYDTELNSHQYAAFDPFIMLNGTFYTMEHAMASMYAGFSGTKPEYTGDTINVKVDYDETYDEYSVSHADGTFKDYVPLIRATELLYDTVSMQYNYNIYLPDWAQVDMDFDSNPYGDDSDATWWSEFNAYNLYIWGDASDTSVDAPAVGDQIKLARYGRELVFNVVEVEEKPSAINNVIRTVNDNKLYNVLGIEVDKDYKGVVIRNGEKFLQR